MNRPCHLSLASALVRSLAWGFAAIFATVALRAQVAVTNVTYGTMVDTTNRTAGNITYLNQFTPVATIGSSLGDYTPNGPVASDVFFRRNPYTDSPNNSTTYYQYSSLGDTSATVIGKGDTTPTMGEVMMSSDLTQGLRNPFANTGGSTSLTTNIERIDFYFAGGYTVQAGDALVFFDLENPNNFGDGFRIAAYTSVGSVHGSSNAPTAYANTGLLIQPNTHGPGVDTPTGTNARYLRSTTTNGDNIASGQSMSALDSNSGSYNSSDLYLVGILIPFADLGLSVGQTIYGYSLMAGDVSFTNTSQMVSWKNDTYYPTNTDSNTWGNVDFAGFGAQISRPVPEPSTYGAILLLIGGLWLGVRRYRSNRAAA